MFKLGLQDDVAGNNIQFRKNGNSNAINAHGAITQVANITVQAQFTVACDIGRVVEYNATNTTFTTINLTVVGWIF